MPIGTYNWGLLRVATHNNSLPNFRNSSELMKKNQITVLIADDRIISRKGIKALLATELEIEMVGEAVDGRQAVRLVEQLQPDVVLMDARMPVMDGLEATRIIKKCWP